MLLDAMAHSEICSVYTVKSGDKFGNSTVVEFDHADVRNLAVASEISHQTIGRSGTGTGSCFRLARSGRQLNRGRCGWWRKKGICPENGSCGWKAALLECRGKTGPPRCHVDGVQALRQ